MGLRKLGAALRLSIGRGLLWFTEAARHGSAERLASLQHDAEIWSENFSLSAAQGTREPRRSSNRFRPEPSP